MAKSENITVSISPKPIWIILVIKYRAFLVLHKGVGYVAHSLCLSHSAWSLWLLFIGLYCVVGTDSLFWQRPFRMVTRGSHGSETWRHHNSVSTFLPLAVTPWLTLKGSLKTCAVALLLAWWSPSRGLWQPWGSASAEDRRLLILCDLWQTSVALAGVCWLMFIPRGNKGFGTPLRVPELWTKKESYFIN